MRNGVFSWTILFFFALSAVAAAEEPAADGPRVQGTVNYELRVMELDDRVNAFRDEVFRAKARLFLLREQVLQDRIGGARVELVHSNRLRRVFEVTEVTYSLDGVPVFIARTEDGIDGVGRQLLWEQGVPPGPHSLAAEVTLRGRGFGIFSYMRGYVFQIRSNFAFTVDEGRTVEVVVELFEEGGVNTPLEERPAIRYRTEVRETLSRDDDPGVAFQVTP